MDKTTFIQYCGPYSIQTSDATIIVQPVESLSIFVDRAQLESNEHFVVLDSQQKENK